MPTNRRLTKAHVTEARIETAKARPQRSIAQMAREFGVSQGRLRRAVHGETWKDLDDPKPVPRRPRTELTAKIVAEARQKAAAEGTSAAELAAAYGAHKAAMGHALSGRTWKDVDTPPLAPGRPAARKPPAPVLHSEDDYTVTGPYTAVRLTPRLGTDVVEALRWADHGPVHLCRAHHCLHLLTTPDPGVDFTGLPGVLATAPDIRCGAHFAGDEQWWVVPPGADHHRVPPHLLADLLTTLPDPKGNR